MSYKSLAFLFIFPFVFCTPCTAEHHASEHTWLTNIDATPQAPHHHPATHLLDDFPFPLTQEEEETARPILHERAAQMNLHDHLLLLSAYIAHENVHALFSPNLIGHLQSAAAPYFLLDDLSILATMDSQYTFVIANLIRTP